jgi:hypothetical protein
VRTLGNYTVLLIAATEKKSTDRAIAAGDPDGTKVRRQAHEADKSKRVYTPVHHKEDVGPMVRGECVSVA